MADRPRGVLAGYDPGRYYCEMFGGAGRPIEHTLPARARLSEMAIDQLKARADAAEREFYNLGITFTLYSGAESVDRILPFDVLPRILSADEWQTIERGVKQRVRALNLLLHDLYHDRKILKDGIVPADLVLGNKNLRPEMQGVDVAHGTYVHICGIDIVRDETGRFLVLEDNARTPSGVSYVVENRHMMQRAFPDLMAGMAVRPVGDYGPRLAESLGEIAPTGGAEPQIVLLSPGVYNAAYFEHIFLAREIGAPLVEGRDLFVGEDDRVYMKTSARAVPVDVIYRRIDDDFLDPETFNPDSMLGVPGLFRAYAKGKVALANAVGTGVADDKAVYVYMPRIIKYYLDEDAILANVETHICGEKDGLAYTLDHLAELVVKPVDEAGGKGITICPRASGAEIDDCRARLLADPARYVSQPMVNLSVSPVLIDQAVEPRHVDLRPFAVAGDCRGFRRRSAAQAPASFYG